MIKVEFFQTSHLRKEADGLVGQVGAAIDAGDRGLEADDDVRQGRCFGVPFAHESFRHTRLQKILKKKFWQNWGFFIIVPLSNIFIFSKRKDKIGRKMFEKYYEAHDGLSGFEQKAVWSDVGRKVAKFTKGGQIVARRSFYRKGYVFSKEFYYVWATFERKFVAETFKNCPIWSHWFQV